MYLKNIFEHRAVQIAATFGSLAFGLYNLYIMGRTDEIDEICDIAMADKEVASDGRIFKFKRMDGKPDTFLHVRANDDSDDECYIKLG